MKVHSFKIDWSSVFLLLAVLLTIFLAASCGDNADECETETGQVTGNDQTSEGTPQTPQSQIGGSAANDNRNEDSDKQHLRQDCTDASESTRYDAGAPTEETDALSPKRDSGILDVGNSDTSNSVRMDAATPIDAPKECRTTDDSEIACQTDKACLVNVPCSSPSVYLFQCRNCGGMQ